MTPSTNNPFPRKQDSSKTNKWTLPIRKDGIKLETWFIIGNRKYRKRIMEILEIQQGYSELDLEKWKYDVLFVIRLDFIGWLVFRRWTHVVRHLSYNSTITLRATSTPLIPSSIALYIYIGWSVYMGNLHGFRTL